VCQKVTNSRAFSFLTTVLTALRAPPPAHTLYDFCKCIALYPCHSDGDDYY
jgi:hypothetical protein